MINLKIIFKSNAVKTDFRYLLEVCALESWLINLHNCR